MYKYVAMRPSPRHFYHKKINLNFKYPSLCIAAAFLIQFNAKAQVVFTPPPKDKKPQVQAIQSTHTINIDGKLSEDDWNKCTPAKNFMQSQPNQGKKATYDTEVRVLYDDKNIYISAVCHNPGGKVLLQDLRRDFLYGNNDLFGVFIDPFQDVQSPVQSFLVTPLSTQRDLLIYDDRIYDLNWDAVWQAKCTVTDSSWVAEIAIPWSTLRYPAGSTTWSINFNRNIRALNEVTGWSPWPLGYTVGRMAYAGIITGLHPPDNKANIRLEPYALVNSTKDGNDPKLRNKPEIGGEIKWLINTNTMLEGTINTDFAQADVDRQVINLKRSSVFFPEKRQFFLENANLFAVGQDGIIQPFFSRRIGLNDNGSPLPIDGGVRLIHQTSKDAIGGLFIRQTDHDSSQSTYFGVLRAQKNLSNRARIGALLTYRYDEASNSSNAVISADGYWHITQPFYVRPMVSVSLPDNKNKTGAAWFTEVGYVKNRVAFLLYETYVNANYQPKTGYIERTNFINTQPSLLFTLPVNWLNKRIRYFAPGITADIYHTASTGNWQEANFIITPFQVITPKGTSYAFSIQPSLQNLRSDFQIVPNVAVKTGIYRYNRYDFTISTDLSIPYSLMADYNFGGFYNGKLKSYTFSMRTVPIPNIAATLSYTYNRFYDFETTGHPVNNYLLAPELRVSFTPKIQLSGFYQYNTVSNQGGLNSRFSWEYKPLSFIYLVYNDLRSINVPGLQNAFKQEAGILKISYIRQL